MTLYLTDRNENTLRKLVNQPSVDDQRAELNKNLYNLSQKRVKIIREYSVRESKT